MNLSAFTKSLNGTTVPEESVYLKALWYDAKGNWKTAHSLVDELEDKDACWVHTYLHRKEGDISNAGYWYARAGKKRPAISLDEEWEQLVRVFLKED